MNSTAIEFDGVWKKFRRGERHDSLRDLVPSTIKQWFSPRAVKDLQEQEFWALRNVTFRVGPGEALGIIGPNGAGKSTVLKLLTGILGPTKGRCEVRGRVGALIELSAGFHPDLTGRENVYLMGAILGMAHADASRHFADIVEFAGLGEFIDTPVKRYSSGMNARLGFSIAAHLDPDVLLIDEVLAVGDFAFQQKCFERLREFRSRGLAIVFVSHNLQAIASLCDTALLLRPGQEPLLADVPTIVAEYSTGATPPGDPRVVVQSVAVTGDDLRPLTGPIAPGTSIVVHLALQFRVALKDIGVKLQVVRIDGLTIFTGQSMSDGQSPLSVGEGGVLRGRIRLKANVLRGTYVIHVHLVHPLRTWSSVVLHGVGSFVVHETTSISGCCELEPAYELSAS